MVLLALTQLLGYSIALLPYKKMLFDHPLPSLQVASNLSLYCEDYRGQPVNFCKRSLRYCGAGPFTDLNILSGLPAQTLYKWYAWGITATVRK